eukprot:4319839-Ditylum_brightwellii.AAC.1
MGCHCMEWQMAKNVYLHKEMEKDPCSVLVKQLHLTLLMWCKKSQANRKSYFIAYPPAKGSLDC